MRLPLLMAALAMTLTACVSRDIAQPSLDGVEVDRITPARELFGAKNLAAPLPAAPYGGYSRGCMAGGVELAETGPTWQAMRLSRNRNWALPITVDFLQDLSRKMAALPGSNGIYIGDMSQPRGGPMLTGHRSHQNGLDADLWLMPARLGLSREDRENISAISMRRAKGAYTNDRWGTFQHELIKNAASDPRVSRIFVFPGAKVRMCREATGDRTWLRKVRPWSGHHYHIHVRLHCPRGASGCENQTPIPAGDGCADAQDWVNNILNPQPAKPRDPNAPPPPKPVGQLRMGDLPQACQAVLAR